MKKGIYAAILAMWSLPAMADLYAVTNIPVSAEAENAVAAKEMALDEAARKAFPILMNKLVLAGDASLITAEPEQISSFVQGVSVANEKNTPTKYMADVTVQFKQAAIRNFLTARQIPFLDKEPPRFLLVPVYHADNGQTLVFEEDNPLFYVMKSAMPDTNVYQFVVPWGDAQDIMNVPADVSAGNFAPLNSVLGRYKVDYALIVDVTKTGNIYRIKTISYPENASAGADVAFAVSSGAANIPAVMKQIMKKTVAHMERKFKSVQMNKTQAQGEMTILFPIQNLAEWTVLEKKLKGQAFVEKVDVKALYQNKVYARLIYTSDDAVFLEKMARAGFNLTPMGMNYMWQRNEYEGNL